MERTRIILLLDMDCFYAQCETIRLGLDQAMPLALLQWNSALAVNYPARKFGIKRGDSYDMIVEKSKGDCIAIHLPLVSVNSDGGKIKDTETLDVSENFELSSLEDAYDKEFRLPDEEQKLLFESEKNKMRHSHEGKASLERYRIASAKIFATMTEALTENLGHGRFILERASIDEIFLDVTKHAYDFDSEPWRDQQLFKAATEERNEEKSTIDHAKSDTVIVFDNQLSHETSSVDKALWRGCAIALALRQEVYSQLGFTLSAGVSVTKSIAKLGAGYGKPNGQAVIFPSSIEKVLDETPLRKIRNLGGKVGKKVLELLPENQDTLASVVRYLSLNQLSEALGEKTGRFVYDLCCGVDNEPVKETVGALTKSITAFKSFGSTGPDAIIKWIRLLASDLVARAEIDGARNRRVPKLCAIHYTGPSEKWGKTRSIRIPFPKDPDRSVRLENLVDSVYNALITKGNFPIRRLGLCATEFEMRPKHGIDSFFKVIKGGQDIPVDNVDKKSTPQFDAASVFSLCHQDSKLSFSSHNECQSNVLDYSDSDPPSQAIVMHESQATGMQEPETSANTQRDLDDHRSQTTDEDADTKYARLLQASFDREKEILDKFDQRIKQSSSSKKRKTSPKKTKTITSFFKKMP